MELLSRIEQGRIIAIFRGDFGGREEALAAVLQKAGITALEVTLNSPGALRSIQRLSEGYGNVMAVGAGTVLRPQEVEEAADAGAQFIVSPNRNLAVIAATKRRGLVSFPGCFTVSEVLEALDAGADAAKIFPAQCLGSGFVKAMRGPLPGARLIPTGGVTAERAGDYLRDKAWAVGAGSELMGRGSGSMADLERLRERAEAYVASVRSALAA